ncbi:MAG: Holliday junction branch migration protein RuvA [bacterium]
MFAHIRGKVDQCGKGLLVLDVSGVGFSIAVPERFSETVSVGQDLKVFTQTVLREDSISLYGFISNLEKRFFLLLQQVKGIGPRAALNILSALGPDSLARIIASGDVHALKSVPGIGQKSAQRVILELQEKVALLVEHIPVEGEDIAREAREVLVELGCTHREAEDVVRTALSSEKTPIEYEVFIARCFRLIGEKKK